MSQPQRFYDPFPNYEAAGAKTKYLAEGAASCIQPPPRQDLSTPTNISRFRKSYKHAAGVTITHYGKVNDPQPPSNLLFGKKSAESDHVLDILKDRTLEGVKGYMRNLKEAQYASNKNEPFGHGLDRGYKWPETVQDKNFAFGVPVLSSESAKEVLYSHPGVHDDDKARQLYVKSHNQFDAGEQKKRDYQWPFDVKNHVFGRSGKMVINETKLCMQPETGDDGFPKTIIVKKNVEDFKDFAYNSVGRPRNLGQTNVVIDSNHVFGYRPKDVEAWNAAKCIHGEPTSTDVGPDRDLGKSVRYRNRSYNMPQVEDTGRVFGLPTIRNDVKKPTLKSVADNFNYGDEPDAFELLNPERFHTMGVSRKDFEVLRPKEEIRTLFTNIGYGYRPGKFEGIFMRAQELCGSDKDCVSIKAFIQAIKEMDHIN